MPDSGKVSRQFFEDRIAPKLGADRDDVALGPKHGVDFGVLEVGDRAVVIATDPVSVLPALGWERAGRFAIDIVLADVAVSGIPPTHLTVSFALPPEMTDEEFGRLWDAVDAECRELGVAVVTGHTARYAGASFPWVGAATGIAVGNPDEIVRPDGARPGDDLLVTKGPAVEAVGLLSTLFPEEVPLSGEALATAQPRLEEATAVRDALTAAAAGQVTAMHDATEGGLLGALHEMAEGAGVRLSVDADAVPVRPGVEAACEALGMDPWRATTSGTLVVAVDPADTDAVVAALEARDTPVGVAGRVEAGSGVAVDGVDDAEPSGDSSWAVYERLLAASEA
ncbi:AIR synthase family protein [Natronomonas marina]|uniref:AIR synthase family protein n=1 Tax=Natronomonas marina TaxID=2961939 RepID=UPI0020C9D4CD|nr:AIR synthase family protein [Natronomonas marina]